MSPAALDKLEELRDTFHGGGISAPERDPVLFELRMLGFAAPHPFAAEGAIYVRWLITWEGECALTDLGVEPTTSRPLRRSAK